MEAQPVGAPRERVLPAPDDGPGHRTSTKVTLLISWSVVFPPSALLMADSRRKIIPSSRAARLMSALERRRRVHSATLSVTSSSSQIAERPLYPVPPHSRQPAPS